MTKEDQDGRVRMVFGLTSNDPLPDVTDETLTSRRDRGSSRAAFACSGPRRTINDDFQTPTHRLPFNNIPRYSASTWRTRRARDSLYAMLNSPDMPVSAFSRLGRVGNQGIVLLSGEPKAGAGFPISYLQPRSSGPTVVSWESRYILDVNCSCFLSRRHKTNDNCVPWTNTVPKCRFCNYDVHPSIDQCPQCGAPVDKPSADLEQRVRALLGQGQKIEAIKLYKD